MSLNSEDVGQGPGPWGPGGGPKKEDQYAKIRQQAEEASNKAAGAAGGSGNEVGTDGGLSPYSTDPQRIIDQGTAWRRNWSTAGPGGLTDDLARAYAEAVNKGQVQEKGIDIGPRIIQLRFNPDSQDYNYNLLVQLWRDPTTEIEYVPDKEIGDRLKFCRSGSNGSQEVVVTMKELDEAAAQSFQEYRAKRSGKPLHVFQMSSDWTRRMFLEQFSRFQIDVPDTDLVPVAANKIWRYNRGYPIPFKPDSDSKK